MYGFIYGKTKIFADSELYEFFYFDTSDMALETSLKISLDSHHDFY